IIDKEKLMKKDLEVVAKTDYELPADKIITYTEETFYDKVIVGNGFQKLKLKNERVDFTSARNAYPSLMVGAYFHRVFTDVNRNIDKRINFAKIRQDLEKAKYYTLKANTKSVNQIYKNHIANVIRMFSEQQQRYTQKGEHYLSEQDYNAIISLLEEYNLTL
ncbi:MAG: hypothetical protein QME64_10450, partial [bacterium]|nr:hypothetical protein [bacterium]